MISPAEGVSKIPGTRTETEFQLFAQPSKTSFPYPLIPPSFLRETVQKVIRSKLPVSFMNDWYVIIPVLSHEAPNEKQSIQANKQTK